jgi:transposase
MSDPETLHTPPRIPMPRKEVAFSMTAHRTYSDELRERAVGLVMDGGRTVAEVSRELGIRYESLRRWVRAAQAAADEEVEGRERQGTRGRRAGGVEARVRELEHENRELRRANEVLKSASAMFAAELSKLRS